MNTNWRYALITLAIVPILIITARSITTTPFFIVGAIAALLIAVVTFKNPENGLIMIVFSMLLSPEIVIAKMPGRDVTLRVDDLLIVAMIIAWLAYTAKEKDWKGFVKTPLDINLTVLIVIFVTTTGLGIISGNLNPFKSFFYMLKYFEYFVLFWVTANIISSTRSLPKLLLSGAVTCIIVTIYAYSMMGSSTRVSAPFDQGGEPASLAGYYLVIYGFLLSFYLNSDNSRLRYFCIGLSIFILPTFIKTLSRASYMAFIPMVFTLLILTKKRKAIFSILLLCGITLFPLLFRGLFVEMTERVNVTFTGYSARSRGDSLNDKKIRDPSAIERMASWKWVINERLTTNVKTMLIGNGVTGTGFIDGQLFTYLGEIGLLGVIVFYWMLYKIIRVSYSTYITVNDETIKSLSLGLIGVLVAMLFQSIGSNTFIIVRINEPFWFMTALVMIAPTLLENEQKALIAQGSDANNAARDSSV